MADAEAESEGLSMGGASRRRRAGGVSGGGAGGLGMGTFTNTSGRGPVGRSRTYLSYVDMQDGRMDVRGGGQRRKVSISAAD